LNARLAPEVLLHPVCSKVSGHAFDTHLDVFDLRFGHGHNQDCPKQNEHENDSFYLHSSPFLATHAKLLRNPKTDVATDGHERRAN